MGARGWGATPCVEVMAKKQGLAPHSWGRLRGWQDEGLSCKKVHPHTAPPPLTPRGGDQPRARSLLQVWQTPGSQAPESPALRPPLTPPSCACGMSVARGSARSSSWPETSPAGRPPASPRSGPASRTGRAPWSSSRSTPRRSRCCWLRARHAARGKLEQRPWPGPACPPSLHGRPSPTLSRLDLSRLLQRQGTGQGPHSSAPELEVRSEPTLDLFIFLWLQPWHMEVSGPGTESEPQLQQRSIPNPLSQAGDRTLASPATRATAVGFSTHCATGGAPFPLVLVTLKSQGPESGEILELTFKGHSVA